MLNARHVRGYSIAELINISASDADRSFEAVIYAGFIYSSCLIIVCVTGLTWWLIGPAALVGIFCYLLVFPLQVWQYLDSVLHSLKLVYMYDRLQ